MISKDFIMKTPEKKKKMTLILTIKKILKKVNQIKVNIKKIHLVIVVYQLNKSHQ